MIAIKAQLRQPDGPHFTRFSCSPSITFDELVRLLSRLLPIGQQMQIKYEDDEEDHVNMNSQIEWEECLRIYHLNRENQHRPGCEQPLRLIIDDSGPLGVDQDVIPGIGSARSYAIDYSTMVPPLPLDRLRSSSALQSLTRLMGDAFAMDDLDTSKLIETLIALGVLDPRSKTVNLEALLAEVLQESSSRLDEGRPPHAAVALLEKAAQVFPACGIIQFHLASSCAAAGMWDEAAQALRNAREVCVFTQEDIQCDPNLADLLEGDKTLQPLGDRCCSNSNSPSVQPRGSLTGDLSEPSDRALDTPTASCSRSSPKVPSSVAPPPPPFGRRHWG